MIKKPEISNRYQMKILQRNNDSRKETATKHSAQIKNAGLTQENLFGNKQASPIEIFRGPVRFLRIKSILIFMERDPKDIVIGCC